MPTGFEQSALSGGISHFILKVLLTFSILLCPAHKQLLAKSHTLADLGLRSMFCFFFLDLNHSAPQKPQTRAAQARPSAAGVRRRVRQWKSESRGSVFQSRQVCDLPPKNQTCVGSPPQRYPHAGLLGLALVVGSCRRGFAGGWYQAWTVVIQSQQQISSTRVPQPHRKPPTFASGLRHAQRSATPTPRLPPCPPAPPLCCSDQVPFASHGV